MAPDLEHHLRRLLKAAAAYSSPLLSLLRSGFRVVGRMTRILIFTLACLLAVPATAQVNYAVYFDGTAQVVRNPNGSGDIAIAYTCTEEFLV